MPDSVLVKLTRCEEQPLVCSSCGAPGHASCTCGVAYIPAASKALAAIAETPQLSNRAIAKRTGVNERTVRRAREATAADAAVEPAKRLGLDGKRRKPPRAAQEEAPLIHEECDDCTSDEERWHRSCAGMLGEMLSLRHYWQKEFGKWEKFKTTTALLTLAEQAAAEMTKLAQQINTMEILP